MAWYTFVFTLCNNLLSLQHLATNIAGSQITGLTDSASVILRFARENLRDSGAPRHFIQLEKNIQYHMHVVVEAGSWQDIRMFSMRFERAFQAAMDACDMPSQGMMRPLRGTNGAWRKINGEEYLRRYLLEKSPYNGENAGWIRRVSTDWDAMDRYDNQYAVQNEFLQAPSPVVGNIDMTDSQQQVSVIERTNGGDMTESDLINYPVNAVLQPAAEMFMKLVEKLAHDGITTLQALKKSMPIFYANKVVSQAGKRFMETALNDAKEMMLKFKLSHYMTVNMPALIAFPETVVGRIMECNGINPKRFAIMLYNWADHATNKLNTMCLWGPPGTGKTIVSTSISMAAPTKGMINKNNENFPYAACVNKTMCWFEEGRLTQKLIEDFKVVSSGGILLVDVKHQREQEEMGRTPLVMTTNNDPFIVYDGNSKTGDHEPALRQRMILIKLGRNLDSEAWFSYPSDEQMLTEIKLLAQWGKQHKTEPYMPLTEKVRNEQSEIE